jgi:surfeit locus 1 family protein
LGFIPYEYKNVADRFKLEDASVQVFEGFVSQLSELSEINGGNVPNRRCASWDYVDLEQMA